MGIMNLLLMQCNVYVMRIFLHLSDLRLAFSSDEEQLSWLKAFERSGAITGQTEEVRLDQ